MAALSLQQDGAPCRQAPPEAVHHVAQPWASEALLLDDLHERRAAQVKDLDVGQRLAPQRPRQLPVRQHEVLLT